MGRAARSLAAAAVVLLAAPSGAGAAAPATGWSVAQLTAPSPGAYDLSLTGVSCTATDDCWAVGWEGIPDNGYHSIVAHWDGSAWRFAGSPAGAQRDAPVELLGISCPSSTACWAVGWVLKASGTLPRGVLIERWDGRSWALAPVPPSLGEQASLQAVDCPDPALCFAVGKVRHQVAGRRFVDAPLILGWDGHRWTVDPAQDPSECPSGTVCGTQLWGVACRAPGERRAAEAAPACLAVGGVASTRQGTTLDQPVVEELHGGSWKVVTVPRPPDAAVGLLTGVSCVRGPSSQEAPATTEPTAVAAAAPSEEGGAETRKRSSTRRPAPTHAAREQTSPSAASTSAPQGGGPVCVAVGTYDHEAQYRFNGRKVAPWTSPYALAFASGSWSLMTVPVDQNEPDVGIHGLACESSVLSTTPLRAHLARVPECIAVGDSSLVENLPIPRAWVSDGSSWSDLDTGQLGHSVNSLDAVSCIPRTVCVATGWTIYESATTTAAAFAGPPGPAVQAAASERRQAVIATYSAPSAPAAAAAGGPPSGWTRTAVALLAAGIALAAGLVWRRRRRHRTRDTYGDRN